MAGLGATVRMIRQNKGLTLAEVADDEVTASFLSKFERGAAEMSVAKFLHVLTRIFTTPEEFFYIQAGTESAAGLANAGYHHRDEMLAQVFGDSINLDSPAKRRTALKDLDQRCQTAEAAYRTAPGLVSMLHWRVQQILRVLVINLVQEKPIAGVTGTGEYSAEALQYLYNVNDWGEFELYLFTLFSFDMRQGDERRLFRVALKRSKKYASFTGAPLLRFDIVHNQLFLEMNRREYAAAGETLPLYAQLLDDDPDAYHEIWYRFIYAWWLYRTDKPQTGEKMGATAVQLATTMRMKEAAQYIQTLLTRIATHGPDFDYSFYRQIIQ